MNISVNPDGSSKGLLEVDALDVRYRGGAIGVGGVSFNLEAGTTIGIVGSNGAGKTSILKAIAGFMPSEQVSVTGQIRFRGRELPTEDPANAARDGIAVVPDAEKVFGRMTVIDHIRMATKSPRPPQDWFALFPALEALRDRRAGFLSGGERQMLALTAAVLRRPKLLLIDEVGLGLSMATRTVVINGLMALQRDTKIAMILVEQGKEMLEELVDEFLVIDHGLVIDRYRNERVESAAALRGNT